MARKPQQESVTAIPKTGVKYVKGPDTKPTPVTTNTQNTRSSSRRYSPSFSPSAINALVFLSFAVGGTAILAVIKQLIPTGTSTAGTLFWLSLFTPLVILLGYLACSWYFDALKTRKDQIGDNLYYLGFIFTLGSLAVSLLDLDQADKILANFGLAIWSTLWGIVLRTAVNQLRFDPNEIEEASRQELSEASRRVSETLKQSIEEFSTFQTITQQKQREGYEELQKNINEISDTIMDSLKGSAEPIKQMIGVSERATSEMSKQINKFATNTEKFSDRQEKLLEATLKIADAMEKFSEEYKTSDTIGDSIKKTITAEQTAATEQMIKQLNKSRAKVQRVKKGEDLEETIPYQPVQPKQSWWSSFLFGAK